MAAAGYDPHAAIDLWQRMEQQSKSAEPLTFLSTNPSDAQRIEDIKKYIPTAMKYASK
jgi:predicted Zn-dependent protease